MSKAFIASVIQEFTELSGAAAIRAAGDLMQAILRELKKSESPASEPSLFAR